MRVKDVARGGVVLKQVEGNERIAAFLVENGDWPDLQKCRNAHWLL